MEETLLTLSLHKLPLHTPWTSRRGTTTARWSVIVRAHGDGADGLGEAPLPLRVDNPLVLARDAVSRLPRLPADAGIGARDILDQADLPPWLRHGVMNALLDRAARYEDTPLCTHLSRTFSAPGSSIRLHTDPDEKIPVNANLGPVKPEQAAREATRLVEAGFRTIKLKSLGDPHDDTARLHAIRDAVGDTLTIRLDANGAWTQHRARAALEAFAPYGLEYVEEPLGAGDLHEKARFAQETDIPIAWDESVQDPEAARILAPSAAALVVKPPRLGGCDRFLQTLAAATDNQTPVVVSSPLESTIGLALDLQMAALCPPRYAHGLATGPQIAEDLAEPKLHPRGGTLILPTGPGIGTYRITQPGTPLLGRDITSG